MAPPMSGDRRPLATASDVSQHLGVPVETLRKWRYLKRGPQYVPIGKYVRYRWTDVEDWLDRQTKHTGEDR